MAKLRETSHGKTELHKIAKEKACSEKNQQLKRNGIALSLLSVTLQITTTPHSTIVLVRFASFSFHLLTNSVFSTCFVVSCAILFDVQCSWSYRV